ncbi:MAG: hypothetical protein IKM34_01980 [Clostridia bacterium]|nr:hypothetical protein [Clostridia bacterium]
MNKQPPIAIILTVLRSLIDFLLIFFASSTSHYFVYDRLFSEMIEDGVMPPVLVFLYSTTVYLIAFFMFTRALATYHKPFRHNYTPCHRGVTASLQKKILLLFKTPSFLIALAVTLTSIFCFPYASVGKYLALTIFGNRYSYGHVMLMSAVALPFVLVLFVFAYLAAARSIRNEGIREKQKQSDTPIRSLVWDLFNIFLAVVCASILIPLLIVMASQFLIFLVFFPAVVAAVIGFWILRYIRAIRIRSKFIHSLKSTCQKNRYKLSKIQKPYRSLFFITDGISFSIKDKNGKQYDCKLLHSIKRTAPMFLHSDGFATLVSPINFFKAELGYRVKTVPYSFESNNSKCVIVCPIPRAFYARNESSDSDVDSAITESKFIFAGIGGARMGMGGLHEMDLPKNARSKVMDIGDSFNNYKFYNATGFLNAIKFNVFDR